jgi:endoglucanase
LACLGARVRFLNGALGLIGSQRLADSERAPRFEALFIDLGASSRADCPVRPGDLAVFDQPYTDLGSCVIGKALQNRVGVAALINVLLSLSDRRSTPHELHFVFSAQGQVGARGAAVAAYSVDPDLALVLDLADAGDTPTGAQPTLELGRGPAILVRDGAALPDARLVDWMVQTAEKGGLPYQLEISDSRVSGGRVIQLARAGVPLGCLSIPCRYLHTPCGLVDVQDVEHAAELLLHLLGSQPPLS